MVFCHEVGAAGSPALLLMLFYFALLIKYSLGNGQGEWPNHQTSGHFSLWFKVWKCFIQSGTAPTWSGESPVFRALSWEIGDLGSNLLSATL